MKITLTGEKDIDAVLKGLPLQITDKVLQTANASAAKVLVDRAKLTAPEGPTGHLIDSIGVVKGGFNQVTSLQRGIGAITVGPRRGGQYKGWVAHLVEYFSGRPRFTKGNGKIRRIFNAFRGVMRAKPFMEPAFIATKDAILLSINTEIGKKLYSFMKRTIKNAK